MQEADPPPPGSDGIFSKQNLILYAVALKWCITGVLMPLVDMGTDIVTAGIHFHYNNPGWGAMTLLFVWVPGFVVAVAIAIRGLSEKVSKRRVVNYLILILLFPLLYPIIVILV